MSIEGYCFLCIPDTVNIIIPEITSPAIAVSGDSGISEAEAVTGWVITGDDVAETVAFSDESGVCGDSVKTGEDFSGKITVILLLRVFLMVELLTCTTYFPGCISLRNQELK